jgi:hypothetical protein
MILSVYRNNNKTGVLFPKTLRKKKSYNFLIINKIRDLSLYFAIGGYARRLAAGNRSSGEPRGYDPSAAGRDFMLRPRKEARSSM